MEGKTYLEKSQESLRSAELSYEHGLHSSCINRAYYAAFQAAVAALLQAGLPVHRERDGRIPHDLVSSSFAGLLVYRRKLYDAKFRRLLEDLFKERVKADYRPVHISERAANQGLRRARDLVEAVGRKWAGEETDGR